MANLQANVPPLYRVRYQVIDEETDKWVTHVTQWQDTEAKAEDDFDHVVGTKSYVNLEKFVQRMNI